MTVVKMRLSQESIGKAIERLQHYAHGSGQGSLDALIEKKMQVAVNAGVRVATTAFNNYIPPKAFGIKDSFRAVDTGHVTVVGRRLSRTTWVIEANGRAVSFMEFGTGFYTTETDNMKLSVPYNVYPGSWSENHGHTYEAFMASGKDPGKYIWNSRPTRAMEKASISAQKALKRMSVR